MPLVGASAASGRKAGTEGASTGAFIVCLQDSLRRRGRPDSARGRRGDPARAGAGPRLANALAQDKGPFCLFLAGTGLRRLTAPALDGVRVPDPVGFAITRVSQGNPAWSPPGR